MPGRSAPVPATLLCGHRVGPGSWAVRGPLGVLSAGAPGRGSGSLAGPWTAVDASRDADVTWKDKRGQGESWPYLPEPLGATPPPCRPGFAIRDSAELAWGSAGLVSRNPRVSVFFAR